MGSSVLREIWQPVLAARVLLVGLPRERPNVERNQAGEHEDRVRRESENKQAI
jgi:hypothetical protein